MSDETFLFDDFFVPQSDAGIEELVTIRGRQVPIFFKRGMSLGDREQAKAAATKTHITPKGELVIDGFDQGVFTIELLARLIKSWPFTRNGTLVTVSRENIVALGADVADALQTVAEKYVSPQKTEALAPFETPSDAA